MTNYGHLPRFCSAEYVTPGEDAVRQEERGKVASTCFLRCLTDDSLLQGFSDLAETCGDGTSLFPDVSGTKICTELPAHTKEDSSVPANRE